MKSPASTPTRRDFLKTSGAVASASRALTRAIEVGAYAAEDGTIDVAIVGCGGRGTGAVANALSTPGPTRLIAMADVFPDRMKGSVEALQTSPKSCRCRPTGSSSVSTGSRR